MNDTPIWLSDRAKATIEREAAAAYPYETGGVLAGYVAEDDVTVLCLASGPGPNANHRRWSFAPDHDSQLDYLASLREEHGGRIYYLGDWHTHPQASPTMSLKDRRTLMRIAAHKEVSTPHPIMLILGESKEGAWQWVAHRFSAPTLAGVFPVAKPNPVRFFRLQDLGL